MEAVPTMPGKLIAVHRDRPRSEPGVNQSRTDYERQFLEHLGLIQRIVRAIGRRHRLPDQELEDFSSSLRLKLIENDYQVFRRFSGRSSLATYLSVVATRHFLDERTARWGRWRPCTQATRFGKLGVLLDRLLNRDGYTFDQAVHLLRTNHRAPLTEPQLDDMSGLFPRRSKRRFVGDEELDTRASETTADSAVAGAEGDAAKTAIDVALKAAMARLPAEDRLILRLRFREDLPVVDIARLMRLEPKPLYRRLAQLTASLRRELEGRGVHSERAQSYFHAGRAELASPWGADADVTLPEAASR